MFDPAMDWAFELCVRILLVLGDATGVGYRAINVIIFCIIWPVITLALICMVWRQRAQIRELRAHSASDRHPDDTGS